MDFAGIHPDTINVFILVFVRVTAIIVMLPVFGTDFLPIQLKVGFSFLLSILVFPFVIASKEDFSLFRSHHSTPTTKLPG